MMPPVSAPPKPLDIAMMEKVAFILKTTAHPTRIAIVDLLHEHGQQSVRSIGERIGVEQSLISHHLTDLKLKGVLSSTRDGKNVYYALKMTEVITVIRCLAACEALQ